MVPDAMSAPADRPAAARLTAAEIAALEVLVTAAPVGPWSCADELNKHDSVAITQTAGAWGDIADAYDLDAARFICASRAAVPALLAEVRRQRRVLADLARCDAEVFRIMGHEADLPREES